jgi:hypothetical protein
MNKLKRNLKCNLLIMLLCVLVASISIIPLVAMAATTGIPNLQGFYLTSVNYRSYDLDGVKTNFDYRYFGIVIANNTTDDGGVVLGYIFGFNAATVRGAKAQGHTTTYNATINRWFNRQKLTYGDNSVNVTATGLLGVYVPMYCEGVAVDGEVGALNASPTELVYGWNTLNVTTAGDIEIGLWMSYSDEPLANLFGLVGEGSGARFALFATDIITVVNDTADDVLVGVEIARVITPGETFVVGNASAGNITIYMPYGTVGNITPTDVELNGKTDTVVLSEGTNVILVDDEDEDGGEIDVNVVTQVVFEWTGRVVGKAGNYRLSGTYTWFSLPDYIILSGSLNARTFNFNPLAD